MAFSAKELLKTVGAVAAIVAVCIEGIRFVSEARTDLKATYYPAPFAIPRKLQDRGPVDTAFMQLDTIATRFYDAYYQKLTSVEREIRPDSMRRYRTPRGYYETPMADFARNYRSFGVLHVQNDGDKTLTPLQVLHKYGVYYQYKDSNDNIRSGVSTSRFAIGELVAGESRDINLWGEFAISSESPVTITYPDGKIVTSRAEQVDGFLAWIARSKEALFFALLMLAFPALVYLSFWLYYKLINKPSGGQVEAQEE